MYVTVSFLNRPLLNYTYCVPQELQPVEMGDFVYVPLQKQSVWAYVASCNSFKIKKDIEIKNIIKVYKVTSKYHSYIRLIAQVHLVNQRLVYKRITSFLSSFKKNNDEPLAIKSIDSERTLTLSNEQNIAYEEIINEFSQKNRVCLLHGYTGSGKTAVYAKLIQDAFGKKKSSCVIMPDMITAYTMYKSLKMFLPNVEVSLIHSSLAAQQKNKSFDLIARGVPTVYVGVHIPLLLPIDNVDLIIIDEEHNQGHKVVDSTQLCSKRIALLHKKMYDSCVLLGSATPSVTSIKLAEDGVFKLVALYKRFYGVSLPRVISSKIDKHKNKWITDVLREKLIEAYEKQKQSILFINRRGSHCFARCKECGYVFTCESCSMPSTIHHDGIVKCHHCFYNSHLSCCKECGSEKHLIEKRGIGTQSLLKEVQSLLPCAKIEIADLDSLKSKRAWPAVVERMNNKEIDVLIGTQGITKGVHFPNVSLVAAVWADMHLCIPSYTSYESTVQDLTQLAGRAGREHDGGVFIIQTLTEHSLAEFVSEERYNIFYKKEIKMRQALLFPPFCRMYKLSISSKKEESIEKKSKELLFYLERTFAKEWQWFGPVKAMHYKKCNVYTIEFVFKVKCFEDILHICNSLERVLNDSTYVYSVM